MTIQYDSVNDILIGVLEDLGRAKVTDISYDLVEHHAMAKLMKKGRLMFDGGDKIQRNLVVTESNSFEWVGLWHTDNVSQGNHLATMEVPWRHATANWAYDKREKVINQGAHAIVDLCKVRRMQTYSNIANQLETAWWSKPSSSSDTLIPFGVPYWIVKSATTTVGLNGGNATGFSSGPGGLDSSTYGQWKNYAAAYTTVDQDDLIAKMRECSVKTKFKSPAPGQQMASYQTGDNYAYYTNYNVLGQFERLLMQQNENLGNDLAPKDGHTMFRGNPVVWIDYLEQNDSTDPVYGINFGTFHAVAQRGLELQEDGPHRNGNKHTVYETFYDLTMNFICDDRRRNFVLSTGV